jgi:hypothetical protein
MRLAPHTGRAPLGKADECVSRGRHRFGCGVGLAEWLDGGIPVQQPAHRFTQQDGPRFRQLLEMSGHLCGRPDCGEEPSSVIVNIAHHDRPGMQPDANRKFLAGGVPTSSSVLTQAPL